MLRYLAEYTLQFCLLGAILCLPGAVLLTTVFRERDLNGLRPLAGICTGVAVWMASVFALAAVGQLHGWSVLLLCAGWLTAAITLRLRRSISLCIPQPENVPLRRSILSAALLALMVIPCLVRAMRPDVAWDAGTYHLNLPKLYITHQGFRPVEFDVYSNWPLNTELLFTLAMLLKDHILATLVHFGFGILTLLGISACCRVSGHRRAALLAMLLFLANRTALWEMTVAYIDLAYTFFFLAGFIFMLRALDDPPNRRTWLLLSGLCCGMLAGTKLNGIVGAAVIAALLLPDLAARGLHGLWPELQTVLAWFILPVVALFAPWLVKAAWYTGNPVYPFLYNLFGGPDWSPTLSGQLKAWQKSIGMGRTFFDYLLLPIRVILLGNDGYAHFDGRICRWWLLLIPITIVFGRTQPLVRRCLAVAGLYFLAWSISSQQIRLLIPILPLLAIASAVTINDLCDQLRDSRRRRVCETACLVLAAATAIGVNLGNCRDAAVFLRNLRAQGDAVRQAAVPPVFGFVNQTLPPNARLLCLNTNQGFFLDRAYLADSFFEASQIADWLRSASTKSEVRQRLDARGITHILVDRMDWGTRYPPELLELLADPGWARPIYRSSDGIYTLFELALPTATSP